MVAIRLIRRFACVALASFAFAQGAAAAMGCTMLSAQGDIAIMPSGEPCEMMGAAPAPMTLKTFAPDANPPQTDGAQHLLPGPTLPVLTVALPDPASRGGRTAPFAAPPHFLGPPPYLSTLRLRV